MAKIEVNKILIRMTGCECDIGKVNSSLSEGNCKAFASKVRSPY